MHIQSIPFSGESGKPVAAESPQIAAVGGDQLRCEHIAVDVVAEGLQVGSGVGGCCARGRRCRRCGNIDAHADHTLGAAQFGQHAAEFAVPSDQVVGPFQPDRTHPRAAQAVNRCQAGNQRQSASGGTGGATEFPADGQQHGARRRHLPNSSAAPAPGGLPLGQAYSGVNVPLRHQPTVGRIDLLEPSYSAGGLGSRPL